MKIISLIFSFLTLSNFSIAQSSIEYKDLIPDKTFNGFGINSYLKAEFAKEYVFVEGAILSLKPIINYSKLHSLEGIKHLYKGQCSIGFQLKYEASAQDTVITYPLDIEADNRYAVEGALLLALKEKGVLFDFIPKMEQYAFDQSAKGCEAILNKYRNREGLKSIRELNLLINQSPSCKPKLMQVRNEKMRLWGDQVCDEKIQELRIMAASGIEFQMIRAVDLLKSIPPQSKCSAEALDLAKSIGNYFQGRPNDKVNLEIISINQILQENNIEMWLK